jgi:hypothetical protein
MPFALTRTIRHRLRLYSLRRLLASGREDSGGFYTVGTGCAFKNDATASRCTRPGTGPAIRAGQLCQ